MFKRRKDYIVTIIANNYKQDVQVKAEDKKIAENMVDNVLLGTDLFDFKNKCAVAAANPKAFDEFKELVDF